MTDALKVLFLVNASVAVSLSLFYELVRLCLDIGISPWIAGAVVAGMYWRFLWRECREATHG